MTSSIQLPKSTKSKNDQSRPIWLTDELSQEWIDSSSSKQKSKQTSSLRIPSNSRIPILNKYSTTTTNLLQHQSSTFNSSSSLLLQPSSILPKIPSLNSSNPSTSQIIHSSSSPSLKLSDPSIVLNSNEPSENHTPPWLKAAVDGMVNQLLGKRPTQLEKIFQNSSTPLHQSKDQQQQQHLVQDPVQQSEQDQDQQLPIDHLSPPTSNFLPPNSVPVISSYDSINRVPSSSIHPMSAEQSASFLPNIQFQFSVPRSRPPLISFEDSLHQSTQPDSNPQSVIEYQQDNSPDQQFHDYLSVPIQPGCNIEHLRFNRDSRLDNIIEVTEPSSSTRISGISNQSRISSSNFGSLPSDFNAPSLPFAHRTPVIGLHGRIHRIKSDTQLSNQSHHPNPPYTSHLPHDQCEIPSCDKSDTSASQTRFRFTYDTFTRRHLTRLTEEIHGLSVSEAITSKSGAPLKIKSILGSPGEEVTDSSTSIGLAHSTPPVLVHSSSKHQQNIFHAGRTPFRPITSLSQRLREEQQWNESFVEPSSYAIDSISPAVERKCYQGPQRKSPISHDLHHQPDIQTAPHSCRSSKRIRLDSSQLRDSVALATERNRGRRTPAFTRVHPMVVFKASTGTATNSNTPHEKTQPSQTVVRDRLAEAKALMDRIRAKTTPGLHQEDDQAASWPNQTDGCVRKQPEPALEWDISIDEGPQDDRDKEGNDEENREGETSPDNQTAGNDVNQPEVSDPLGSVHQRLASTAATFLRQTLGDSHGNHQNGHEKLAQQYGSSSASTLTNLAGTTASRRQFATQPISREPIGRVTNDICNQFTKSNSTVAGTTVSAPTPALTIATSTRQSSSSLHSNCQQFDDYAKQPHTQKLGLMTIAPCDVEELLQNRRVGNMVFDSTIGKWVKIRSQSDTGGMLTKTAEDGDINIEAVGEAGTQHEESSDEEDIFKDIESLNSKRESDSSGSGLLARNDGNPQANSLEEFQNDGNISNSRRNSHFEVGKRENDVRQSSSSNKKISIVKRDKFKPKSVLKTASESPNDKSNAIIILGSIEKSQSGMGALRPGRSVSFQDGRKNGKIIGLVDENEAEEENNFQAHEELIKEQHKSLKESNMNKDIISRKHKKLMATDEVKGDKLNSCHNMGHHDQNAAIGLEDSFDQNENNQSLLNQTSLILINSAKKKVRRKSSSSNSIGATNSNNNSLITTPTQHRSTTGNLHNHLNTGNSNSNNLIFDSNSNNNFISEYSFELNYSKLIKIITDFEPFEPFWNSIKVINLSNKLIDSVIRLNEILPLLDQIDLSSNHLNYLTGLPSTLRVLIVSKNQINELCSFNHLQNLVRLDLSHNSLTTLQQLSCLKHLRELKADENLISDFSGIDQLDSLIKLSLKGNRLKKINFESTNWNHLEVLNLDRNQICELTGLHFLKSVYLLNLDRNQIYSLKMDNLLLNLRVLRINENRLESLDVSKLINLRTLYIDNNDLMEISGANQLRKLENLSVRDQRGGELSLQLKQVRDVKRIYLGGNPLPAAFPTSQFYNLIYLELAMCQCQSLPADLANLIPNIRTLNLNYNFLKDISPLKNLKRLERLTIVGSRIKSLDKNLLSVLESLPELELLDFRQNPLCASFYPPLLLKSTPSASIIESEDGEKLGCAPHLNQYQIVIKEQENDWQSIDDRFRKSLPNEFYLKRMTYRSIIIKTCGSSSSSSKKLKYLDGIKINELERKKMEKFLRGLSRKIEQKNNNNLDPSSFSLITTTHHQKEEKQSNYDHVNHNLNRLNKKLPMHHSSSNPHPNQHNKNSSNYNNSNSRNNTDHKLSSSSTHLLDQSNHVAIIDRSRY